MKVGRREGCSLAVVAAVEGSGAGEGLQVL